MTFSKFFFLPIFIQNEKAVLVVVDVSASIRFRRYREDIERGHGLEDIFTGSTIEEWYLMQVESQRISCCSKYFS